MSDDAARLKSLILSMSPADFERLASRLQALRKEYGTEGPSDTIAKAMEHEFNRVWAAESKKKIVPEKADDAPEAPEEPDAVSKLGEVYELGRHRLICGDATWQAVVEEVCNGKRPVVLWTDPPYGVSYEGKTADKLTIDNDGAASAESTLREALLAAQPVLADSATFYIACPAGPAGSVFRKVIEEVGWRFHETLVWVKDVFVLGHSDYHYQHEDVLYGWTPGEGRPGRGKHAGSRWRGDNAQSTVFEIPRPKRSKEHPTMKPVELVAEQLANSAATGDHVLDLFGGSGSTLLACEELGLTAFLVELSPAYCDVIRQRYADYVGDQTFAPARLADAAV